jgi:hypothetical protein
MFKKFRPLRPKHQSMLVDSYQRELNEELPIGVYYTQTAKGLIERGLFEAREYWHAGKRLVGFYLTENGFKYLKENFIPLNTIDQSTTITG